MGRFIVLDGLDASGKETQTEYLHAALAERGQTVRVLSYPRYGTVGAAGVELYLKGGLGAHPEDTGAYAASTLFAVDRYLSYRTEWESDYARDDVTIIANRYTTANAVHQLSKLPREQWDAFLDWLWDFEYRKLGIPSPDLIFYLEMPPDVSRKLLSARAMATGREKDIHEQDDFYLDRCYEAALYASKKLGWTVVHCVQDGVLRTREEIAAQILAGVTAL